MSGAVLENVPEERKDVVVTGENLFGQYSTRDLFLQVQDSITYTCYVVRILMAVDWSNQVTNDS